MPLLQQLIQPRTWRGRKGRYDPRLETDGAVPRPVDAVEAFAGQAKADGVSGVEMGEDLEKEFAGEGSD
jgi:hypothetical protein